MMNKLEESEDFGNEEAWATAAAAGGQTWTVIV